MDTCRNFSVFFVLFLLLPFFTHAEVYINEIMYDLPGIDTGREWIEVYNAGPEDVAINNGWKLSDGLEHSLTLVNGASVLRSGAYAVIVDSPLRFMASWPNYSGIILDSSFSLSNVIGDLALLSSKSGNVLSKVSYTSSQGASGDGNSLQRHSDGTWFPSSPTPGLKNSTGIFANNATLSNPTNVTLSAHYESLPTSSGGKTQALPVSVGRERIGAVGSPMEFRVETTIDQSKFNTFTWNFGDGSQGGGSLVSHTYKYPGDYVVILNSSFYQKGEAVSRISVKIIDPELIVTFADSNRIEIKNNSVYEVNLFGRALVTGEKYFAFFKDTIIKPGQSLSFASNVTGLIPNNSAEVFIAVLGDTEQPQFKAKIEEEKSRQIEVIKNKISELQKKIQELFTK